LSSIGLYVHSNFEAYLLGGYSSSKNTALSSVYKFSVCSGSSELLEEDRSNSLQKPDFFLQNDLLQINDQETYAIFGQHGKHVFDGKEAAGAMKVEREKYEGYVV
jgi:hypothetical protein